MIIYKLNHNKPLTAQNVKNFECIFWKTRCKRRLRKGFSDIPITIWFGKLWVWTTIKGLLSIHQEAYSNILIVGENVKINEKLIKDFYINVLNQTKFTYKGYTFKFVKKDIQLKLIKDKKLLSIWYIENDDIESFLDEVSKVDKNLIKAFEQLPSKAELLFQEKRQEEKDNSIPRKREVITEFEDYFASFKENELTKSHIDQVINKMAVKWLYEWFDRGGNPDMFADNLLNYESQTITWLNNLINDVKVPRVQLILNEDSNKELNDIEENSKIKLFPKYAQREGNLVTISELNHKQFIVLCEKAINFGTNMIEENPDNFKDMKEIQVNWWENEGVFSIAEIIDRNNPRTYRELILSKLGPVLGKGKKSSRIILGITNKDYPNKNLRMIVPQKGRIEWI